MEVIHARCAGLDVHKQTVVACVRVTTAGRAQHEVRTFATTAAGLRALQEWLGAAIAQEPTGATASCTIPTRGVSSASNGRCWLNMRPERLLTNQPRGRCCARSSARERAGGAATARVR
jgi:hypothetical protein